MATEQDRQEERDRAGNDPIQAPPAEELEEENPVDSHANPEVDDEVLDPELDDEEELRRERGPTGR
jgi:hypothetical protein